MARGVGGKPERVRRLGPGWLEKPRPPWCPFPSPWRDKAGTEAQRWPGWRPLFVLQEQQEPMGPTAERHIPTGSPPKNKNTTTILHCVRPFPWQPGGTRRPLLLAFVTGGSWVAWGGSVGWWRGQGAGRAGEILQGVLAVCAQAGYWMSFNSGFLLYKRGIMVCTTSVR